METPAISPYDDDDDAKTIDAGRTDGDLLAPGRMLGEYRIATVVGIGGMGIVLGAIHPLIGKRVAIKVLKTDDPAMVQRFIDEASVVNQIRHPNIVDVFGFGTLYDGRKYFVMEWLDGESLRQRMDRGPIPLPELVEILQPLMGALAAAHGMGVIHRDLKPENIFLANVHGGRPQLKLLDFGIAKLVRNDHVSVVQTASGVMVGTPMYAAPEQAAGKPVDHRIDIYTLGAVLFELLTERPPFVAESSMLVVAKHMLEPAPRASAFAEVPDVLDELVAAMLAKDPNARPSLADISAALDRVGRGEFAMVRTGYGTETPTAQLRAPKPPVQTGIVAAPGMRVGPIVDGPQTLGSLAVPPVVHAPQPLVATQIVQPAAPPREPSRALRILIVVVVVIGCVALGIRIAEWVTAGDVPAPRKAAPAVAPPAAPSSPTVTPIETDAGS